MPSDHFRSHFWQEGLINIIPSPDCCICLAVSGDTHIDAIRRHMSIWLYGHIVKIWPYRHMTIWHQRWPIWVFLETAIKMQQSGEGIKSIRPSCKKWEGKWSDGIFSFVFFTISFVYAKKGIETATYTSIEANKHFGVFWDTLLYICMIAYHGLIFTKIFLS